MDNEKLYVPDDVLGELSAARYKNQNYVIRKAKNDEINDANKMDSAFFFHRNVTCTDMWLI
jgi:hypothetical protein